LLFVVHLNAPVFLGWLSETAMIMGIAQNLITVQAVTHVVELSTGGSGHLSQG
jgi:hypothetical protein